MGDEKGRPFWYVWDMVQRVYAKDCTDQWVKQNFGPTLMLAISWEETSFTNKRQDADKGQFDHATWMLRWTKANADGTVPRGDDNQMIGNHAIGFVQVERDTIDRWLTLNPRICLGLPGFSADMISPEGKDKRRAWFQGIDEKILASDEDGFKLGWRALSHIHLQTTTSLGTLQAYAGKSPARKRSTAEIIKGWRDTDACLRVLFNRSSPLLQAEKGASGMLAGAFYFAKPNGAFERAFPGSNLAEAKKISSVYEKFLNGRNYDQLVNDQGKIAALRSDLKGALGVA